MAREHEHEHDRGHGYGHGHGHGHATQVVGAPRAEVLQSRKRLQIALAITATFMVAEAIGGWISNSQALLADAGHMLSDAGALVLSLLAIRFAAAPATDRKSYGWMRLEILAALANGVALVAIALVIFWEAFQRLRAPPPVDVPLMLAIAVLGLGANIAAAVTLHAQHRHHLNVGAAYTHVLSDLLGSIGAIAAGVVMWTTGWYAADPLFASLVGLLILVSAVRIILQAADVLLEGVPSHIDMDALERELAAVEGVRSIHHLHVWTISSGVHLMTCHAVVGDHGDHHDVLERLSRVVRDKFGIGHSTIQLECEDLSPREAGSGFCDRR